MLTVDVVAENFAVIVSVPPLPSITSPLPNDKAVEASKVSPPDPPVKLSIPVVKVNVFLPS